jgi:glycosyltransferase involved in cell wall biosynthesis
VIHARGHVPAAIGLVARRVTGCGLIFDIRGLMAEEYVDAGRWERGGIPWRLTKRVERQAIDASDACVVLTSGARELLFGERPAVPVSVIPCCADLDRLSAGRSERVAMREELGLAGKTVAVYIGKFGGWYLERQMVEFFIAASEEIDGLHLLVLTQDDPGTIQRALEGLGVDPASYTVTGVPADRVGAALAAADFGISFIAPLPSKIASSPTKIGEYLGAGLPIVATAGVGGVAGLLSKSRTGVMVGEMSPTAYREAAHSLKTLLNDPKTYGRCLAVARAELSLKELGIPRYSELYAKVAEARQV